MNTWIAVMTIMPHSTGEGQDKDRDTVGGRKQTFRFEADSIGQALCHAALIELGIRTNPFVWEVVIESLNKAGD